ncbi:hypothetical protein [Comamonas aquatica]|uniref:hypothetical protein n=1 Tax=Comamonas aquatica TaxID=225991 RepID=UPI0021B0F300|nr:hypothetical protein [Comamonas aquatica]
MKVLLFEDMVFPLMRWVDAPLTPPWRSGVGEEAWFFFPINLSAFAEATVLAQAAQNGGATKHMTLSGTIPRFPDYQNQALDEVQPTAGGSAIPTDSAKKTGDEPLKAHPLIHRRRRA